MWTTVPWENEPKTIQDELHDVMGLIPVILEHFDLAQSCQDPAKGFQLHLILQERCKGVDGALQQWYRKLSSKLPEPLPSAIRTPQERVSPSSPKTCLTFEVGDYVLAFTLSLYWATCIVLYGTMHLNLAAIRAIDPSAVTWEPPPRTDARQYAMSLSESLDYFVMPEMGLVGPQIVSFPMGMALMYLAFLNDPVSRKVGRQIAQKMGSLCDQGVSIFTFMTSMQYSGVPKNPATQAQGESGWIGRAQSWFGARAS